MGRRIFIRPPIAADARDFLKQVRRSHGLHRPWVTAPATVAAFRDYLKVINAPANRAFLICRRDDDAMVGVVNVTNIVMGNFRSAYLGYYAFAGHERQGLMSEGLRAVVQHAFETLKLHRLEANIQPGNVGSIALARSCGFVREGYSARYLKIGGRWRDHERWAIVAR